MEGDLSGVARLLGREPMGAFEVVVRTRDGDPVVIRNDPFLDDGTPMPTLFWLVGAEEVGAVGRLEAGGGVKEAEALFTSDSLAEIHARYALERDGWIVAGSPHNRTSSDPGNRPSGGVGGTRRGIKCLHAHLAWHLAGGDDAVGRWVAARVGIDRDTYVVEARE